VASELFPIIATRDVERALAFYRDLLGARVTFEYPGPDGAPVYVGLDVGASHLGVGLDPARGDSPAASRSMSLWVYVDDCDVLVDRLRASGVEIVEEPADQPWGERVARVRDFDGNEVLVGARPPAELE
jgi:lactoylglutathione lyase